MTMKKSSQLFLISTNKEKEQKKSHFLQIANFLKKKKLKTNCIIKFFQRDTNEPKNDHLRLI